MEISGMCRRNQLHPRELEQLADVGVVAEPNDQLGARELAVVVAVDLLEEVDEALARHDVPRQPFDEDGLPAVLGDDAEVDRPKRGAGQTAAGFIVPVMPPSKAPDLPRPLTPRCGRRRSDGESNRSNYQPN
eukprot:gene2379-biopygen7365